MLIRDTLRRDLSRKIEEIVKVDQTDEVVVHEELSEYVVTPSIRDYYLRVLTAIAEAPKTLSEGVGIWVSGFFGSGKSSFAKNLGYVLENQTVAGEPAAEIFKQRVDDPRVANLIDSIHTRFPVKVIMFDVQSDRSLGPERRSIAHYMYRVLLRELDYAEDFDLAELEITLEADGNLEEFCDRVEKRYKQPWRLRRKMALKMSEASAILSEMDPATYPSADSWAKARAGKSIEATPRLVVERSYDLVARRLPGHALIYIIDEVGQYIARSSDRIEDVRSVVELLGKEGRNRVRAKKAVSPVWFVATSQERLDEVISAMGGDVRIQMAKVQDRFPIRVDLSPADIREIVVKRVLEKKPEHVAAITELYSKTEGSLKTHAALERTRRPQEFEPDSFAEFHPYLPHHIDLSIDIVSGIRHQPGADRTIGGATRTIIKQAYEILVNDRTRLADEPVGTLVTLDKLFELLEPSVGTDIRKDVNDVGKKFAEAPWCSKVIRAVVLLSFVKNLPCTARNIAALLYPNVEAPSPLPDVEQAIKKLTEAQHLQDSEDGYKLLTAQEKSWQSEQNGIAVKPRQREDLVSQLLEQIFDEPAFKVYRYQSRPFPIIAIVRGVGVGKGGILLEVRRAESEDKLSKEVEGARVDSRTDERVYWVFPLTSEMDGMVAELVRSAEMIRKYEQLRAQNKINAEESSSLDEEKRQANDAESRLRGKLSQALSAGQLLSQGKSHDVSALAPTPSEALSKFLDDVVPNLYPSLGHAAVAPKTGDAESILKAANLDALPSVYGAGELALFTRSDGVVKFDPDAPVARDVVGYLKGRVDYGEKPSGRSLEEHFSSSPFGWEPDVLRVVLAGLFRGNAIRITTQGRTYDDYSDQQAWAALTKTLNFRAATFAPQTGIEMPTLVDARKAYISLTGKEVDVDQQKISRALSEFVLDELTDLPTLIAEARSQELPVVEVLEGYQQELSAIEREETQKRIALLAEEGAALKQRRDDVAQLRAAMSPDNLDRISRARSVRQGVWPALKRAGLSDDFEVVAGELAELLAAPDIFGRLHDVSTKSESIHKAFHDLLSDVHGKRDDAYRAALDRIQGDERLPQLAPEDQEALLRPVESRVCGAFALEIGQTACSSCHGSLDQIESDIAAVAQYESMARRRVVELTAPPEKPTKVIRAADHFSRVETAEDVDHGVESLKDELLKSLDEGNTTIVE